MLVKWELKKIITILIINLLFYNISHGENSFTFDVAEIEILEEGNIFLGKRGGIAKTKKWYYDWSWKF